MEMLGLLLPHGIREKKTSCNPLDGYYSPLQGVGHGGCRRQRRRPGSSTRASRWGLSHPILPAQHF